MILFAVTFPFFLHYRFKHIIKLMTIELSK